MRLEAAPTLHPLQVCFVVADVPAAAEACAERFGWGPFHGFTVDVPHARYRGWSGRKVTDVALGMAGAVQVELIRVREGLDCVAAYQRDYGTGLQHLGIACRDREEAIAHLASRGAVLHEQTEYAGIRIAFVDVPTGPATFELLQQDTASAPSPGGGRADEPAPPERSAPIGAGRGSEAVLALDRATIVTADLDRALRFHAAAFGWGDVVAEPRTLRWGDGRESRMRRFVGRAGALELELLEPEADGDDPYARHLARGDHGLVHAGGPAGGRAAGPASFEGAWLETGEAFVLHDWAAGARTLQVRRPGSADPELC